MMQYCEHCKQARPFVHCMDDYEQYQCLACGRKATPTNPRIKGIVVTHTRIKGIVTPQKESS